MTTTPTDPAGPTGPRPPREAGGYSVIDAIDAGTAVRDLYARRSRRVTLGTKTDGPLGHAPRAPDRIGGRTIPAPITKEEEAYLVAAAVGITGPLRADLPYSRDGGGRTMMSFYGRTIASPDAAHNQRLIVLNDAGSWLIRSPQDFPPDALPELVELVQRKRWNDWYDRMRVRLSARRAGIPRRLPYQVPFNWGTTNLPGTTYLLPIADVSGFCLNVLFSGFEQNVRVVLRDLRRGVAEVAGLERWLRGRAVGNYLDAGDADRQGTIDHLSELVRGWTGNERGQIFANLARAAQELNLDGFPHFAGALAAWGEALDFQMLRIPTAKLLRGGSAPRNLMATLGLGATAYSWHAWLRPSFRRAMRRHIEVPVALERDGEWLIRPYTPPFYTTMEDAVRAFAARKFDGLRRQLAVAISDLSPQKARALDLALEDYSEREIRQVAAFAQYCLDRYGVFPHCGEPGPLAALEAFQVHVADPHFYASHYGAKFGPGPLARATRPLVDGTDVGVAPTPPRAPQSVDRDPPWRFEADHLMLLYDVPKDRLSLPAAFEPVTHGPEGELAELLIGLNHIVAFETDDQKWVPPYDEIMVSVRVRHTSGAEGSYYLKLHLDQRIPLDMGVVHFGYPKERAHIERWCDEGRVRYRAENDAGPLCEVEAKPLERLGDRIRAIALWNLFRLGQVVLDPGATLAFFRRGSETLQTRWVVTPKATALRFVELEKADFPFVLEQIKDLEINWLEPKLALHSHTSRGRSDTAEPIPTRASPWVRARLVGVAWSKAYTDALVRWLRP